MRTPIVRHRNSEVQIFNFWSNRHSDCKIQNLWVGLQFKIEVQTLNPTNPGNGNNASKERKPNSGHLQFWFRTSNSEVRSLKTEMWTSNFASCTWTRNLKETTLECKVSAVRLWFWKLMLQSELQTSKSEYWSLAKCGSTNEARILNDTSSELMNLNFEIFVTQPL